MTQTFQVSKAQVRTLVRVEILLTQQFLGMREPRCFSGV